MRVVRRNNVYEIKVANLEGKEEKNVSEKMLARCKEVAKKYPKK